MQPYNYINSLNEGSRETDGRMDGEREGEGTGIMEGGGGCDVG